MFMYMVWALCAGEGGVPGLPRGAGTPTLPSPLPPSLPSLLPSSLPFLLPSVQVREVFLVYRGVQVVLPFMKTANRVLCTHAVDTYLLLSVESGTPRAVCLNR